ncbi:stage IV sporulation protein FB [Virgibacillus halophilus]|uniref:Stage IV sporulation protein FB n=1 Tax=Tigheibacillus halophilus TaxID=361280 RepID=A0ABU5CDF4_9BACI|nr:stage IV sporulation protein FB [Virgibacillus halophilus]
MRFLLQRYHGKTYVAAVRPLVVGPDATLMEVFSRFERNKKHSVYITYPGGERRVLDENDCLRGFFHEKLHLKKSWGNSRDNLKVFFAAFLTDSAVS